MWLWISAFEKNKQQIFDFQCIYLPILEWRPSLKFLLSQVRMQGAVTVAKPEMTQTILQGWIFVTKNYVNKILKLDQK